MNDKGFESVTDRQLIAYEVLAAHRTRWAGIGWLQRFMGRIFAWRIRRKIRRARRAAEHRRDYLDIAKAIDDPAA